MDNKNKIKIIADSTSDLTIDLIEKYNIDVLPLTMHIGEESYKDGETITLREMFKKIEEGSEFPTTSQVNPDDFYSAFNKAIDEGYEDIICITISERLSGTYQSALIAREMIVSDGKKFNNIALIDSELVSGPIYLVITEMLKMIDKGEDFGAIVKTAERNKKKVRTLVYFDTLEHLVKGGRLPKTTGRLGGLLKIKPMLTLKNGLLEEVSKVRGQKRGHVQLKEFITSASIKENTKVILINSINDKMENELIALLKEKNLEYISIEVGCVLGTHGGPGLLGAFYIEK